MITIKDVADRAGYAKSTVSRYINSSGYVAQQTGVAIQKAIDDLDYHPNQIARELSMGETSIYQSNYAGLIGLCDESSL